ncbi:hypothetical protein [Rhizobium sp. BK176]|uniref:hypothetical protein n=1 Tax=Rhizobium sp. BK176 TaxID=2587071 RepID=UPI00216A0312|nr:hypothetical protein [Rhizobium sp. BK176]MCS4088816.1 hypothetical protein [Rhizobium sp. BK176]
MAYGTIDLTSSDIAYLLSRLECVALDVQKSKLEASSEEERTFYEQAALTVEKWRMDVGRYRAGRRGFTEEELRYIRGTIAERQPGSLASALVEAKRSNDPSFPALEAEYELRRSLQTKLDLPFTRDHSQDAELDDDDEEEGA